MIVAIFLTTKKLKAAATINSSYVRKHLRTFVYISRKAIEVYKLGHNTRYFYFSGKQHLFIWT